MPVSIKRRTDSCRSVDSMGTVSEISRPSLLGPQCLQCCVGTITPEVTPTAGGPILGQRFSAAACFKQQSPACAPHQHACCCQLHAAEPSIIISQFKSAPEWTYQTQPACPGSHRSTLHTPCWLHRQPDMRSAVSLEGDERCHLRDRFRQDPRPASSLQSTASSMYVSCAVHRLVTLLCMQCVTHSSGLQNLLLRIPQESTQWHSHSPRRH
jgi:hypothetical protein